ncbi:HTTM domain-containing protein [Natronorubrum sp. FCH18a]|uniref:HTTM domain-containing protein n=1 Tax=Natronorubrum sp. FCH18a TaxID=3447018 RepID=UPI003F518E26
MGPALPPSLLESGHRLRTALRRRVRIDTRTLAVFRVVVGLLVVADLFLRSRNFTYFYTDDGVAPRSLVLDATASDPFSIYHLTTDPTLIAALFVLQGLIAVQLIVGYRTRIATVLTFLFVVSLDHHNPFVLSYADTLFRLLLFWAIFLPLGERWSVDAVHADRDLRPSVANAATALITGQMVYMYFTNGLIKSQSDVWTSGDAAPLVLGIDEITFLLGDTVRQVPALLELGGLIWFTLLVCSPLLILLPGRWRYPLIALFAAGHLAFAVSVRIGAFPYVALAGLLLFLQTPFWDDLQRLGRYAGIDPDRFAARATRLERGANRLPAAGLRSERAMRIRGHAYTLALGAVVVTLLFVAAVMVFNVGAALADDASDQSMEERVEGAVDETLAETTGVKRVEATASRFGIDQPIGWGVFAGPDPRTTDRYYVFPAETERGDVVDAYNDRELTYERPHDGKLQKQYGTYRERFYMNSVRRGSVQNAVPDRLADHICEQWVDDHDEELAYVNMYAVHEDVTYETVTEPGDREREYLDISYHGCGDNEPKVIDPPE